MAPNAPIDPDLFFSQVAKSAKSAAAILEICDDHPMAMLRRVANYLCLPVPDGVTSTPAAWRNREASKEALSAEIANYLAEDDDIDPQVLQGMLNGGMPCDEEFGVSINTSEAQAEEVEGFEAEEAPEVEASVGTAPVPEPCAACSRPTTRWEHGVTSYPLCDACSEDLHVEIPDKAESAETTGEPEPPQATDADQPTESQSLGNFFEFEEDRAPFEMPEDAALVPETPGESTEAGGEGSTEEATEETAESDSESEGESVPAEPEIVPPAPTYSPDLAETIARAVASHLPATGAAMDEDRIRQIATEIASDLDAHTSDTLRDWAREQIELEGEALRCAIGNEIKQSAAELITSKLDECAIAIAEQVKDLAQGAQPTLRIEIPGQSTAVIHGTQHAQFPTLLNLLAAGLHVMLVGPSGSGKTHGCEQAAEGLSLPFYCLSVGAQTTLSQIMGYMDATGRYVSTVFRQAFEKGGVFLLDEIDAGNPNVLTALNAALSNKVCAFPDGMVGMSPLFRCVAAANTFGNGQDRQYVGRNQLDATSLDRFAVLPWNYDEAMERKITGFDEWVTVVHALRHAAMEIEARHIISPRASILGAKLLLQGAIPVETIMDMLVFKGCENSLRNKIMSRARDRGFMFSSIKDLPKIAARMRKQQHSEAA